MPNESPSPFLAAYRRAVALGRTLDLARRVELGEALSAMCMAHADTLDDAAEADGAETARLRRRNALYLDALPMAWRGLEEATR